MLLSFYQSLTSPTITIKEFENLWGSCYTRQEIAVTWVCVYASVYSNKSVRCLIEPGCRRRSFEMCERKGYRENKWTLLDIQNVNDGILDSCDWSYTQMHPYLALTPTVRHVITAVGGCVSPVVPLENKRKESFLSKIFFLLLFVRSSVWSITTICGLIYTRE